MDRYEIETLVKQLFIATDERQWNRVEDIFAEEFFLDYHSFTGDTPAMVQAKDIAQAWASFLPGFDYTHHQIGNMITEITQDEAKVFCYGTATQYIEECQEKLLTIVGTYTFIVKRLHNTLKITSMTFDFKYKVGNTDLDNIAKERVLMANR